MDEKELDVIIGELENRVGRYEDRLAIEKIMGRYVLYDNPKNMHRAMALFASQQADVSIEWADKGCFVGRKKVEKFLDDQSRFTVYEGRYRVRWLTNPMIQIAADRKTARAAWCAPGAEAMVESSGTPRQLWNFVRFAVDFIREGEEWRIWHLRMFQDVRCEYEDGWAKDYYRYVYSGRQPGSEAVESTYVNAVNPTYVQEAIPACPCPYETWDGDGWVFGQEPLFGKRKNAEAVK